MCPQISTRGTWDVSTVLFLQGKESITSSLPRRLGMDVHSSLGAFAQSVWLEIILDPLRVPYHKAVFSQSVESIFMEGYHMYFTKIFDEVVPDIYLAYFAS